MADFYSAGTFSPMIPAQLITDEDSSLFDAMNINSETAGEDEQGNKLVYLFNEDYCTTGYIEVEGEDDKEVGEDDLYEALQGIIKRSNGLLTYISHEQGQTCSRMCPNSHGGTAVFITADDIRFFGTQSWLQERINEITTGDMTVGAEDNDSLPPSVQDSKITRDDLLETLNDLIKAGKTVVDSVEGGDLARAITNLDATVGFSQYTVEKACDQPTTSSKGQAVVFMKGGLVQEVIADTPVDVLICDLEHEDYDLDDLASTPNGDKCHYVDHYVDLVATEKTAAHFAAYKAQEESQEYKEAA